MSDFQIPDKDLLTSVDRSADTFIIYDNSASGLKRTNVNYALDLTSHPVGIDDVQTLTNKTLTAPTASSPVLSGTVTGTYTLGGTPTFPSSVVTLTGSQTLTNKVLTSPTINNATITNPTLTIDSISEFTSATGVTIDGVLLKDSKINGSYLTNASVNTAQITANAVAIQRLSVAETTDVLNGTVVGVATWTDVVANKNFTVDNSSSVVVISIAGRIQIGSATVAALDIGSRIIIDSAGTPITRYLGGSFTSSGGQYANPLAGAGTISLTGLAAGTHTIKLQLRTSVATQAYLRCSSQPELEYYRTEIVEYKK